MLIYKAFYAFSGVQVYPVGTACVLVDFPELATAPTTQQAYYAHLHNAFKSVLRLFYFVGLISLHRHNKNRRIGQITKPQHQNKRESQPVKFIYGALPY